MITTIRTLHFWAIAALTILGGLGYYGEQIGFGSKFFSSDYTHDLHRGLLLIPMLYAAAVFRIRGAIILSIIAFCIVIPRGLMITENPDPLLRPILAMIIASIAALLLGIERGRSRSLAAEVVERQRAEQEIRRLNAELEQRVIERTAELAAINRELEAFSYSVSHDLRAPLRSIDGFGQALLEDYDDKLDEQGKDYLRRMRTASQRMGELIDDLLGLSRVTRSEMHRETVNLSQLAQRIAAELQQREPGRPIEFDIAEGMTANVDAHLMYVALENLMENAWKFTSRHSTARVEFGMSENEGKPAYFVRDDGAGFDMAYAGKLFGAFQRLHDMREFEGTGIGLATVQRIIHRHGGQVWAEGAPEKGATFYFTLQ